MSPKRVAREDLTLAPCRESCPAGIDVPRYIRRIREGKFDEALAVIRERIPFPSICGYACYSPCEARCGNRQCGDPIAIRALKRAAAERGGSLWRKRLKRAPATGKRIAVVGAGPSGLTAAYYLALLGHKVVVLEALEEAGGMMRVGIPAYRLPRKALNREIGYLKRLGVEIRTGCPVASLDGLVGERYDAVYLACGAHRRVPLGIPGDDAPGVLDGISFLKQANQGESVSLGVRVAVIGGGNTAVDAARSAIRLGAREVTIFYRRSRGEMTAYGEEVEAAEVEGVALEFLAAPVAIAPMAGGLEVTFTRTALGKPDGDGRPPPHVVPGSEFKRIFHTVIAAVGQRTDVPFAPGLATDERGFLRVDGETLATDREGVFAGGDAAGGPASIIGAISHGRKAAASVDRFLGGSGAIDQALAAPEEEVALTDGPAQEGSRVVIPCIPLSRRRKGFEVVEKGLTRDKAVREAQRCRDCDARQYEVAVDAEACKACGYCVEVCGMGVFEPTGQFNRKGYRPLGVKGTERCVGCMLCFYACPDFAIQVEEAI
jgi:NADPH-dependent glutamate synthase beta subunit-like oxidoreductase/NAD-dependent dihydropyrimidine dehydrogenase PreA subunit